LLRAADKRSSGKGTTASNSRGEARAEASQAHPTGVQAAGGQAEAEGRSAVEKTARLLLLLGKDQAAEILKHLEPSLVEQIAEEISKVRRIDATEAQELLDEFGGFIKTQAETPQGGTDVAERMLTEAFGSDRARELVDKVSEELSPPLSFLNDLETHQLRLLLSSESPQVIALVLAQLERNRAAAVLKELDDEQRKTVVLRMARMQQIDRAVLERIEEALREKIRKQGTVVSQDVDGTAVLSRILRQMRVSEEQSLLNAIAEQDEQLAERLRDELFTIDTLLYIEDRDLQRVLGEFEDETLALALRGKEEEIRRKVLENVSENRKRRISDVYAHHGPARKQDVDDAAEELLGRLKQLEREGTLVVRSPDEEYI
jgi:flagellar motor switch protein FliG